MGRIKNFIKRIISSLIRAIIPIVAKFQFKENVQEAQKKIESFKINEEIYRQDSIKRKVVLDDKIDLSMIIPVYNASKNLEKCLTSLINQKTKYTFEIILVDDGSTDNSSQILEEYKNGFENIVVIYQENGGAGKARNIGINYARRKIHRFYR